MRVQDLISMLKGKKTISWATSPTCEVRKRSDTLKRYATLSTDLIHTNQKQCPLMLHDVSME